MKLIDTLLWHLKRIKLRNKSFLYKYFIIEMICAGSLPVISLFFSKIVIDSLNKGDNISKVIIELIVLCIISLIFSICSAHCNKMFNINFPELRHYEMFDLNEKYQAMDYDILENETALNEIQTASEPLFGMIGFQGVYFYLAKLLPTIFSIVIYLIITCSVTFSLAVVCVASSLISLLISSKIRKVIINTKEKKAKVYRQKMFYNKVAYDSAYGKDIRIFSLTDKLLCYYQQKSNEFIQIENMIISKEFNLKIIALLFNLLRDIFAYGLIMYFYYQKIITIGELTLFVGIIIALSTDIEIGLTKFNELIKCLTNASNYINFLTNYNYEHSGGKHKALAKNEAVEIEFKNVTFTYPNIEHKVLDNFSLKINKNEKIAIVGLNGAGKTTLIKLLLGLLPISSGDILLNGISINEFDRSEYFKMFSVVFQDVNIFAATIFENITDDVRDENNLMKVKKYAIDTSLDKVISKLPLEYDTELLKILDDNGVLLSGGEAQKLALVRALYKNGNIVVLDEPTASLDALAEANIYEQFNNLSANKTAIFISHRLTSTKFCDRIILLDKGKLKECGTHEELIKKKGLYYRMFIEQGKYYKEQCNEKK